MNRALKIGIAGAGVAMVIGLGVLLAIRQRNQLCAPVGGDRSLEGVITATLESCREGIGIPGLAAAVVTPESGLITTAVGAASAEGAPLQVEALFRVGGVTKTYTAVTVLTLVEDGSLALDDTLAEVLGDTPIPQADEITVEMLLRHTSGVHDYTRTAGFDPAAVWTQDELIRMAAADSPDYEPGRAYQYSHTNYILLGEVVQAVTGQTFVDVLHARVLNPLNLTDTYLAWDEPLPEERLAAGTMLAEGELVEVSMHPSAAWTAGALVTTVPDAAAFLTGLFEGEIIGEDLLRRMTTPAYSDNPLPVTYGYGVDIGSEKYGTYVGHTGSIPGYTAYWRYVPQHEVLVVVFHNMTTNATLVGPAVTQAVFDYLDGEQAR